jgi:5'-nucleotidase
MSIRKLTILHNNDMHGDFLPHQADGHLEGGISYLANYIQRVRHKEESVLYVNAGDMFRGSIIDSEFRGISTIELMNYLAPDVFAVGNHEVDYGVAHLLFLEKCARFPIINANLYIKTNRSRLFKPYQIIEINGLNIMFIGVITEEVLSTTKNEEIIGSFIDLWEAAEEVGVIIDNYKTTKVDLTVLVTHIGLEADKQLAAMLNPEWGVDMIIGAHSHTLLESPIFINGIPIVQVGHGSSYMGRWDIEIDTDKEKIAELSWTLVPITSDTCEPDPIMEQLLHSYKDRTDEKYSRIITTFKRPLTHPSRYQETELGNLFADLLQEDSSYEVMLMASGSIRKETLGPILTYQDLKEVVPYDEAVIMLSVTGKQFRHMMQFMLRDEALAPDAHTEFYQLSKGMRILYNKTTRQIEEFKLNGEDITDERMIRIAVQDGFHYNSFTEFFDVPIEEVLANAKPRKVITSQFAIFEELLSSRQHIDSHVEGRIEIKE